MQFQCFWHSSNLDHIYRQNFSSYHIWLFEGMETTVSVKQYCDFHLKIYLGGGGISKGM